MRLAIPLSVLLLGSLAACSPLKVNYDYDVQADYSRYHTYDWTADSPSDKGDDFTDHRIRAAVEKELTAKGFRRADSAPDLLVNAYPIFRDSQVSRVGVGVGIGLRILPGVSVGLGTGTSKARTQSIGRIFMEFRDTRNSRLIWKAEAEDALEGGDTPEEAEEAIHQAVSQMLERFPPKGPSGK